MSKAKAVLNLDLQLSGDALRGFLAYMEDHHYQDPLAAAKGLFEEYKARRRDWLRAAMREDLVPELSPRRQAELEVQQRTLEAIRLLVRESSKGFVSMDAVVEVLEAEGIAEEDSRKALKRLMHQNSLYARGGAGTVAPL